MTIENEILYCRKKAEDNRRRAKKCEECANRKIDRFLRLDKIHLKHMEYHIEEAEEYEEIAKWLEELQERRKVNNNQI